MKAEQDDGKILARVNLDPLRPVEDRIADLSENFCGILRYAPPALLSSALSDARVRVYIGANPTPSKMEFAHLCAQAYELHLQALVETAGFRQ
jgi:hypothetical protein